MSTKSCYLYLLSENVVQPHCVVKFASRFGDLYWPDKWRSLHFFDLDCQAIDLSWKISHGVLYTACTFFPLDCQFLCHVFVDLRLSL